MNEILVLKQEWYRLRSDLGRLRRCGHESLVSGEARVERQRLETQLFMLSRRIITAAGDSRMTERLRNARGIAGLEKEIPATLDLLGT